MNSRTLVICLFLILCLHEATPRNREWFNNFLIRSRDIWGKSLPAKSKDTLELGMELHNSMRDDHNTPPFTYNAELAADAEATASAILNSEDFDGFKLGTWRTGRELKFSQNVFNISDEWLSKRPGFAMLWAISGWYDPSNEYDYKSPTPSSFTRLIWKASTDFGMAIASKGKNMVVVANYAPPSEEVVTPENLKLFQENVLPRREDDHDSKSG